MMYRYQISHLENELFDHPGNLLATFTDDAGTAGLLTYKEYFPFGLRLIGCGDDASTRKFGYQALSTEAKAKVEMSTEAKAKVEMFAEEDPVTGYNLFELRQYDSRPGRWLITDPYNQYHSPYLAMGNNPMIMVDPTGGLANFDNRTDVQAPEPSISDIYADWNDQLDYAYGRGQYGLSGGAHLVKFGWGSMNRYVLNEALCQAIWEKQRMTGENIWIHNGQLYTGYEIMDIITKPIQEKVKEIDDIIKRIQKEEYAKISKNISDLFQNFNTSMSIFSGLSGKDPSQKILELLMAFSFILPDAKAVAMDLSGVFAGGAVEQPIGVLLIFKGKKDAGKARLFSDHGAALGFDFSAGILEVNYFYEGNMDDFGLDTFKGWRISESGSITCGIDFTANFVISVDMYGGVLYGLGLGVGVGVPMFFIPVNFNINYGKTQFWSKD